MNQLQKFSDVFYTQQYVYPRFSNGKMDVAETYVALAIGLLDPDSLPPIVIFQHDNKRWCRDTRRLTIARALERNHHYKALGGIKVINAEKTDKCYEKQYNNLIRERIPAMKRKKLDGKSVKVSTRKGPTCCFNLASNLFRDDVIEHVAEDHLQMEFDDLIELNSYNCERCNATTQLQLKRFGTKKQRKCYRIVPDYGGGDQNYKIDKPWQQVSLRIMCDEVRKYKAKFFPSASLARETDDETDDSISDKYQTSIYADTDYFED
jgi:hypothetical protein